MLSEFKSELDAHMVKCREEKIRSLVNPTAEDVVSALFLGAASSITTTDELEYRIIVSEVDYQDYFIVEDEDGNRSERDIGTLSHFVLECTTGDYHTPSTEHVIKRMRELGFRNPHVTDLFRYKTSYPALHVLYTSFKWRPPSPSKTEPPSKKRKLDE